MPWAGPHHFSQVGFKHTLFFSSATQLKGCKKHTPHLLLKEQHRFPRNTILLPSSSHEGFLQKSTGSGSCLSCLQPLMIKSNFFFILVFLKAVLLYASQLSPSWKLYSFLSGMKKESTCSEWDALWVGSVRVQETPQDDSKLHHQKRQCLPSVKAQQSTVRFD